MPDVGRGRIMKVDKMRSDLDHFLELWSEQTKPIKLFIFFDHIVSGWMFTVQRKNFSTETLNLVPLGIVGTGIKIAISDLGSQHCQLFLWITHHLNLNGVLNTDFT